MLTTRLLTRIFAASLVIFSLLAFAFSSVTHVQALAKMQEATPATGVDVPDGLTDADWEQINAILPTAITSQQGYIKASNTESNDQFGQSIAISGNTVVIGAYREDSNATGINGNQANNSAVDSGAAYVFVRSGNIWSQEAYLKASNTDGSDWFGSSVAISGDTIIIGAYNESSNATGINGNQTNNLAFGAGAAYVFTRSGTIWSQQAYLKASNTGAGDAFGFSVAIAGDTIVVGAKSESSNATGVNGNQANDLAAHSGAAYVFTRSSNVWSQQAYLKASNTNAEDFFGVAVGIAGDTVVIGAEDESSNATGINGNQGDNSVPYAGAVYVFTRSTNIWSQQAYIKASNTGTNDYFGSIVAIAGNTVVVGAVGESSSARGINGNQTDNSAPNSGAAYVFVRSGSTWNQQAYIKASNTNANDYFGKVAIFGNIIAIGAYGESSNAIGVNGNQTNNSASRSGAAYVFTRNGSNWSQQSYIKSSNTETSDFFGNAINISGDTLVFGASGEDSNAVGVNGNQSNNLAPSSGAVYAFVIPHPSVISSRRTTASPTTAASVDFSVTFSEPVMGVDASDFIIAKSSGISDAAVTAVSGGPTNYLVTVNTGSGAGNIRLAVYDNDSIVNAYQIPLGGAGAGNGSFSAGETYLVRPLTQIFQSQAALDGFFIESTENSNAAGTIVIGSSSFPAICVGDNPSNFQIRAILHFNTGSLPDTASVTKITLKIKQAGLVGTNPFTTHGALLVDSSNTFFGTSYGFQAADFQVGPGNLAVGSFNPTPTGAWYDAVLNNVGKININHAGPTQYRLRFAIDDNNNSAADFTRFYSGDTATVADRPALVVEYYVP